MNCYATKDAPPLVRSVLAIKRDIPTGILLLIRLGDFYEMFGEDAVRASPVLGATLTLRGGMPMCGVPYHAVNSYLAKLVGVGMSVALAERAEGGVQTGRYEVVRVITPGTWRGEAWP